MHIITINAGNADEKGIPFFTMPKKLPENKVSKFIALVHLHILYIQHLCYRNPPPLFPYPITNNNLILTYGPNGSMKRANRI